MKITCQRDLLSNAVNNASKAVMAKSNLPSLEGVLVKTDRDRIVITGYDLELGITTFVPAQVEQEGSVVLTARLFADMVRKMPGDTVSIYCDDKYLTQITSGSAEFVILGLPADEFPALPKIEKETSVTLPQNLLKGMISQTQFAIAVSDAKPVHTGSLFELSGNEITMVSVDGFRLAMRREKAQINENASFIVPGKTLGEIEKLLSDEDSPLSIFVSKKHIVFEIDHYSIISRLLEGEFLNYRDAIPPSASTSVVVNTKTFCDSIDRVSLIITDRMKSPIKAVFADDTVKILCTTALGKVNDAFSAQISGPAVEIGFNNKYLLDALKAAGCDEVKLELNGPLSPMKIVPLQNDSFLFLVLPVRIKNN